MVHRRGMRFCCCGVPLVNAGAYLIVIENFLLGLAVAVLAFVPPEIVALMGTIPSWSKLIVGILGIALLVWQVLGIISIASQKTGFYRTYIRVNFLLTLAIIAAAAAFLIAGAVQHSNAVKTCAKNFGAAPTGDGTGYEVPGAAQNSTTIGQNICNAFVWAQVGVMGFLIVLWSLTQIYMCVAQRSYGQQQRDAERDSKSMRGDEKTLMNPTEWDGHHH